MKKLTRRRQRFIEEYLVDLNATKAAVRAGYAERGAGQTGHELLKNPEIAARIQAAAEERAARVQVQADDVLRELLRIATVDLRQAYNEDGSLKAVHDLPDDLARAISAIEIDELVEGRGEGREAIGHTKKLKFWDKTRALELLGKHLKMWVERREHSGKDGDPLQQSVVILPAKRSLPKKKGNDD